MKYITLLVYLFSIQPTIAQHLKRQAHWDFQIDFSKDNKLWIKNIAPNSSAFKAGLREGDQIIALNENPTPRNNSWQLAKMDLKAGDLVKLKITRENKTYTISYKLSPKPYEKMEGVETMYGEAQTSNKYYVRTITTRPKGIQNKLAGIFFVNWLSCDEVEINPKSMDGWALLIQDLATKSGMAFMRVEKPGLGDSEGPKCENCDLKQDMDAFKAAFESFKKMPFVDSTQLFVFGGSIGGALAPVLMQDQSPKGIIVANTFSRTWLEHFLDFERTRLELAGTSFGDINGKMLLFEEFYTEYLNNNKTPEEIIQSRPVMKEIWYDENTRQFGRPAAYHQQVQKLNVPDAWHKIHCPVLVVYGQFDWIMSLREHEYITHIVNKLHPDNAKLEIIPGMDHHFSVYQSPQNAFQGVEGTYATNAFPLMMDWIKSIMK